MKSTALSRPTRSSPKLDGLCAICGSETWPAGREEVCCPCGTTPRWQSVVELLSHGLFGEILPIDSWPESDAKGIGLSDFSLYANRLREKLDYTNTFFDREPRLDITDPPELSLDFLISSEVFEHVPPPVERAFEGAHGLLKPGGLLVLTVPYTMKRPDTQEFFPNLHDWRVEEGKLINRTVNGELEVFDDLSFHGGSGFTLEMRKFAERDLLALLAETGFRDMKVWPRDWGYGYPITARKDESPA